MKGRTFLLISAATVVLGGLCGSASAGGLLGQVTGGGAGGAVSHVTGAITNALGGVTGAGGGAGGVIQVTGAVANALGGAGSISDNGIGGHGLLTVNAGLLSPKWLASVTARSNLLNGINAKLVVLSKKDLVKLCLNIGGGSGCGSGHRNTLLGLIDLRLGILSKTSLASLCLSIGGGCGGGPGGGGPKPIDHDGGGPGVSGSGGGNVGATLASLADEDQLALRIKCRDVLRKPASYNTSVAAICRLIGRT
jgi:hypothetical protein